MIFQIFASAVIFSVLVYAYSQARMAPKITAIAMVVSVSGEYLILFPGHATAIANFFDIGRGADRVVYVWMLLSLVVVLNLHLKLRSTNDRLVALTRALALEDARKSGDT